MKPNDFAHLHVHTEFSLLDGKCKLDELLDVAQAAGQDAMAITDHGNLFGAVDFYKAARKREMRPVLGIEAYVAPGRRDDRTRTIPGRKTKAYYHLTLLAENQTGWRNLLKLASLAYLEGFYYKPRIDKEAMRAHSEGLICLSGCLAGEVNQAILRDETEEAERIIREYQEIYGRDNFFLEVMNHHLPMEDRAREAMKELAKVMDAPLVATHDIHYIHPEDWEAQDVALCIGTGKTIDDPQRFKMATRSLHFVDTDGMLELFSDMPDALTNTARIAERCQVDLPLGERHLPCFLPPTKETPDEYFQRLCREGCERLYGEITPQVQERLDYEVGVIQEMGFTDYFLIVWDFIRYARENGIPVGPGRGSAAGSIVAYALGITQLDPLHYDLLFERFLNKERVSMPDIDIDFCKDRRGEVIHYVEEKYGREKVAQIITFGTMKARAVIRDVGRVMDLPLSEVDRIAKKIPNGPKDTLAAALKQDPELQKIYAENELNRRLFDVALKLEGSPRHASIHAAGVVISDIELEERVPLYRNKDDITTQWPNETLEELGLLKMDFLGLRTLTIIKEALDNVEATTGRRPDIENIPLDDAKTYELLTRGDACGVFQLESEGMKDLLRRMRPDRFEDVIAVLALYRPGPLGSGMVDSYVRRKHGEEEISYPHDSIAGILEESLGVILYQEQVMRIANVMAGFTLNDADNLRKAMGKKKPEILAKFKKQFVEGARKKGIEAQTADYVFDQIEFFAGYGFNKSHSAAYALVTYQTAWLKANHPVEYMAGLLSCEMIQIDKTVEYIEECRRMGIEVLPPDINRSRSRFTVEDGKVRFALAALKGVGESAIDSFVATRPEEGFRTLHDFCENIDPHKLNKSALEALIDAGAMDSLEGNRAQKLHALDEAMRMASSAQKDRRAGQATLFDLGGFEGEQPTEAAVQLLPQIEEFGEKERLQREKNVLGFYLSGHPLNEHRAALKRFSSAEIQDMKSRGDGEEIVLGAILNSVRLVTIKQGKNAGRKMAVLKLEDFSGSCEAVVFSDLYERIADELKADRIAFFRGEVDMRREEPSLRIAEIIPFEEGEKQLTRRLVLRIESGDDLEVTLTAVRRLLLKHPGPTQVLFDLQTTSFRSVLIQAGERYRVDTTQGLLAELRGALGDQRVVVNG